MRRENESDVEHRTLEGRAKRQKWAMFGFSKGARKVAQKSVFKRVWSSSRKRTSSGKLQMSKKERLTGP